MTYSSDPPPVVVDTSVAVALALHARPDVTAAWAGWIDTDRQLLGTAVSWAEIGNILLRKLHGDPAEAAGAVWSLERVGLETAEQGPAAVRYALDLAVRHRLSVQDATTLGLAIDTQGELATLNRDLARAAAGEGVMLALALPPAEVA
jgi:predicted nucleic acid-binding protein